MPNEPPDIAVGSLGPDFTLQSSGGEDVTLSAYRQDTPVLLYFMREFT